MMYAEHQEKLRKAETPEWSRFEGYNFEFVTNYGITAGGCFSAREHLGKPLTDKLWKDLTLVLKLHRLCIFTPTNCKQKTHFSNMAFIFLGDKGLVEDIVIRL